MCVPTKFAFNLFCLPTFDYKKPSENSKGEGKHNNQSKKNGSMETAFGGDTQRYVCPLFTSTIEKQNLVHECHNTRIATCNTAVKLFQSSSFHRRVHEWYDTYQ